MHEDIYVQLMHGAESLGEFCKDLNNGKQSSANFGCSSVIYIRWLAANLAELQWVVAKHRYPPLLRFCIELIAVCGIVFHQARNYVEHE